MSAVMKSKVRKGSLADRVTDPKVSSNAAYYASVERARQQMLARHVNLVEEERFYNAPKAQADFNQWIDRLWSLDEATALSLGKNPSVVNLQSIRPFEEIWDFAREYLRRASFFASRGFDEERPVPGRWFVAWAAQLGIKLPEVLGAMDAKSSAPELGELESCVAKMPDELEKAYEAAVARIAELECKLSENADENPKSRKTSDRLVYALGLKFKFDSTGRSSAATSIHKLLEDRGVYMDRGLILDRLLAAQTRKSDGDL